MFVIMDEISPWPPVNCNDCRNVSCTEAEQEKARARSRIKAWEGQDTACSCPQNRQGTDICTRLGRNSMVSSDLPQGH